MEKSNSSKIKFDPQNKRRFYKDKFKKKFGSLQEGHGLAYLQKNKFKRSYISQQYNKQRDTQEKIPDKDTVEKKANVEDPYSRFHLDREVFDALPSKKVKVSKFRRAKMDLERKSKEKERIQAEREAKKQEIEEKRKKYREKKLKRQKIMNQKTKRGQPLMRGRMQLLLENVEKLVNDKG